MHDIVPVFVVGRPKPYPWRTIARIAESGKEVENVFGAFGAKMGELLLVNTFGLASFIMVIYVFALGLAAMHAYAMSFFRFTFRCLFSTVALSIIFGLVSFNRADMFHLGGEHGYYINALVMKYADALGAFALSVLLAGILVAVYLHPIKQLIAVISKNMPKRKP